MESVEFKGPFTFEGKESIFEVESNVNGVYLWCVKTDNDLFRVYYVGESKNVKRRLGDHLSKQRNGLYTGHCIDSLKNNIQVLMHRAKVGMVPRFTYINPSDFNQNMINNLYLFYAEIGTPGGADEKWTRCRHESAIAFQIENGGQNILSVGHLRYWEGDKFHSIIKTPGCNIEYLTDQIIEV